MTNASVCPVAAVWAAELTVYLADGRTLVTRFALGQETFDPGINNVGGSFCYSFSPDTQGVQVRFLVLSVATCLISGASNIIQPCSIVPECSEDFFSDVPAASFYYNDIMDLAALKVVSGYSDGTFHPQSNITRGQFAKVVVEAFKLAVDTNGGPHFTDVPAGSSYYIYVETAFNKHIANGYSDGTFKPQREITRGQLARMLVQAAGWATVSRNKPTFSDVSANSTYYDYIETAVEHGALRGYGDGTFRPEIAATRGQAARVVVNTLLANEKDGAQRTWWR